MTAGLEEAVRAYVGASMTGEALALRQAAWDWSDPEVLLQAEEAPGPLIGRAAIEAYWRATRGGLRDLCSTLADLQLMALGDGLAAARYRMTWRATFAGGLYDGLTVAGENRVLAYWRETQDGWRLFRLIEAPLSPLREIRLASQRAFTA
jgi:ketosteroid isomerase-like protein